MVVDRAGNKLKGIIPGRLFFNMSPGHYLTGQYKNDFNWQAGESTGNTLKHDRNKTTVLKIIVGIWKNWLNLTDLFFSINAGMGVKFTF